MGDDPQTLFDYYISQHDWLSLRFSWHEQHLNESFLDLSGFIASISGRSEPERHAADDISIPLGFFQVEQPSRIRYTHLIFIFTILERRARALCQLVRECDPEVTIDLRDLGGTLFERLRTFCDKAAKIPLPDPNIWELIHELQKVRDCIIHCGGCISESRDAAYIRKVVSSGAGLAESPRGYLQVEEAYCQRAPETVISFLGVLFTAAHRTIRERLIARGLRKPPNG